MGSEMCIRDSSLLMHSEKEIPFLDIANSKIIGISSGASAPEELVQNLIKKIKKDYGNDDIDHSESWLSNYIGHRLDMYF